MAVGEGLQLPPQATSPGAAGQCAETVLPKGTKVAEMAVLLVSELVTNAIMHAHSDFELVVHDLGDRLRIEVADADTRLPTLRSYTPESVTGRGLHMVASGADRWGFEATPTGKVVWFELET